MLNEIARIVKSAKASRKNRILAATLHVILWPVLLVPRLLWPWKKKASEPSKILLIRIDGIGDLAMCAAIFPSLRRRFPAAQIDLLTSENAVPIAKLFVAERWLDGVYTMRLLGRGIMRYWRMAGQLRKVGYDAGIDLRGDLRNAVLMWLAGIPVRLGMRGSGLGYLLTCRADPSPDSHQSQESSTLVRQLGVEQIDEWPRIPLQEEHLRQADDWLAGQGMDRARPLCAFHLGAFYPVKEWPVERFVAVARRLHERLAAQIVVVGGPAEVELGRRFAGSLDFPVALAVGQTSLVQTAAVISRCDAFLGADSGPAHVAAGVGCGVVVLFGPAPVKKYHPRSPRVIIMKPTTACDPKCETVCAKPQSHCMLDHTVEAVAAAVESLIKEERASIGSG